MTLMGGRASIFALALVAATSNAVAEPAVKMLRVGILLSYYAPKDEPPQAFKQGLSELGYVEGKNITIEWRRAARGTERLGELAAELVRLKCDVVLTDVAVATRAAMRATSTIPIVMALAADPVADGLVSSLAHPGGNVTGMTLILTETTAKRLEVLRDALPKVSRVALLWHPPTPWHKPMMPLAMAAASSLGLQLHPVSVESAEEFEALFSQMTRSGVEAVFFADNPFFSAYQAQLLELAARHRLPTMHAHRGWPAAGALMSYGPSYTEMFKRAAQVTAKILKGSKPADIPVEQPSNLNLVVNLRTARALGLVVAPSLLVRANEIIQ